MLWPIAGHSHAQDKKPSTVLVVRVPGDENIVLRLRAELNSYRFHVIELPPAKRAEALSHVAEEREAQAAVRAKPDAMAVEVWVHPNGSGARTNEELVNAGPGRDPTVLAVRVTEAMRARGLVLPPLAAAAADSGRRVGMPPDGAAGTPTPSAAEPSVADDDVGPARPTVLPPSAVRPSTPTRDPKRIDAEQERKPNNERKSEPDGKPDAEGTKTDEREAARTAEAERARKLEAKRKADAARKNDGEREADEADERKAKAELTRRSEAKRRADAEHSAEAEREREAAAAATPGSVARSGATQARSALLYAEVGPSGVWSPGTNGLGPALDVFVSVKFRPYRTSSVSLVGLIPLLSTDFTNNDGTAIEVQTFGIGGFGDLHLPLGPVELNVGIGGMAMLSSISIVKNPALFYPNLESQRLAALLGRVGASISLTPDLRLSASVMVGLTVQALRLQFRDMSETQVSWGQPLLFGTLSLELALPWDR